jgi:prepilin-type processing-associated H-X9-DG protein
LNAYSRVAAHHAEILWDGAAFRIEDRSGQGIGVNGVLVPAARLVNGTVVQIGDLRARLQIPAAPEFIDPVASPPGVRNSPSERRSVRADQRWAVIGGFAFGAAVVTVFLLLAQFSASFSTGGAPAPAPLPASAPQDEPDAAPTAVSVLEQSREDAQRASCQSNLKQVALAVLQYQQDYNEKLPLVADSADPTTYGWADALQPYVRSVEIFQCPSEPNAGSDDPRVGGYTDYFFNTQLNAAERAELGEAANVVMMGDGGGSRGRYNSNGCNANDDWPVSNCDTAGAAAIPGGGATRHLNGGNNAFADGHVKWLSGEADGTCPSIGNSLDSKREYSFGFSRDGGDVPVGY